MARRGRLSDEERELIKAQTAALAVQQRQAQQELEQKAALAREQMNLERESNTAKLQLGREEVQGRDTQSRREAALNALGLGQKEEAERSAARGDILKQVDIPQEIRARALAEGGDPTLYNALAVDKAAKRDAAIGSLVPALQKARSDEDRAKLTSALEATYPGIGKDAISKAFPTDARGQPVPGRFEKSTPEVFKSTNGGTGSGGSRFAALADELLGRGSKASAPDIYSQPEPRYVPLGSNPLEGSRLSGLDTQGRQGITTPSGGFIGGLSDRQVARFTGPADRAASIPAPAGAYDLVAPEAAPVKMGALLTNNNENQPVVSSVPTPTSTFAGRGEFAGTYPLQPNTGGPLDFPTIPPAYINPEERRRVMAAAKVAGY